MFKQEGIKPDEACFDLNSRPQEAEIFSWKQWGTSFGKWAGDCCSNLCSQCHGLAFCFAVPPQAQRVTPSNTWLVKKQRKKDLSFCHFAVFQKNLLNACASTSNLQCKLQCNNKLPSQAPQCNNKLPSQALQLGDGEG